MPLEQGGNYKISSADPRVMVPRMPEEDGEGDYYRLLPEGVYDGWEGEGDPIGAKQGFALDANRQYPRGYIPEGGQPGAGSVPGHLPEVEAHMKATCVRPGSDCRCRAGVIRPCRRVPAWPQHK